MARLPNAAVLIKFIFCIRWRFQEQAKVGYLTVQKQHKEHKVRKRNENLLNEAKNKP